MKAILFFVAAGIVRESDRLTAAAIAKATDKRVVFRNATSAAVSNEKPEANEGVAGAVPPQYASFPRFDDAGQLVSGGEAGNTPAAPEGPKNALGLPQGAPEDRESLKAALDDAGIEYHGNAKTEKLADLWLAHFGQGQENGQG